MFGLPWNPPISPDLIQVTHLALITRTQKARFSVMTRRTTTKLVCWLWSGKDPTKLMPDARYPQAAIGECWSYRRSTLPPPNASANSFVGNPVGLIIYEIFRKTPFMENLNGKHQLFSDQILVQRAFVLIFKPPWSYRCCRY